jgi:uncharacterized protein YggU (UPF0235/DUF167 family)
VTKLALRVSPGADRTRVTGRLADGRLQVRVAAQPEKGEANAELVRYLAKALGLPRASVRVAHGKSSRDKLVEVDVDAARLAAWTESLGA